MEDLVKQNDAHYILEEPLTEIESIQSFHPWSINTIRIVSLYDAKNEVVNFMNARIRIGNKKNNVDNFHYDGIGANIDINTGIIMNSYTSVQASSNYAIGGGAFFSFCETTFLSNISPLPKSSPSLYMFPSITSIT